MPKQQRLVHRNEQLNAVHSVLILCLYVAEEAIAAACNVNFDAYLDMIPIAMDIHKEERSCIVILNVRKHLTLDFREESHM